MIQKKNIITNSVEIWNQNKRYRVNQAAFHQNKIWQNVTGINTEPAPSEDNWFLTSNLSSSDLNVVSVRHFKEFTYNGGVKAFDLFTDYTVSVKTVIIQNNIHLKKDKYSESQGIVTIFTDDC